MFDGKAFGQEIVAAFKAHLDDKISPILARIDEIDAKIRQIPAPEVGISDVDALKKSIEAVQRSILEIPAPEVPDFAKMLAEFDEKHTEERQQDAAQVQAWMERVENKVDNLPVPNDGKDADPEVIKELVDSAVELAVHAAVKSAVDSIPPAEPAKSVTLDDVQPIIADAVAKAVPEAPSDEYLLGLITPLIPVVQDGKSVTLDDVRPLIESAVDDAVAKAAPQPPSDEHLLSLIGPVAIKLVDAIPRPENGTSVTIEDVAPLVAEQVEKAISAIPAPKDGVGLAGAFIDRNGELALTLTNGEVKNLGRVDGVDFNPKDMHAAIEKAVAEIPKPKDGLGFEDMDLVVAEDGVAIVFERGDTRKAFALPVVFDRGVYSETKSYLKGNGVTWGGSYWIAQKDNPEGKPDTADSGWRLAVKAGRNARPAEVKVK